MDESLHHDAEDARASIRAGTLARDRLALRIANVPIAERDAWVDVALGMPEPPTDEPLPRGAVPYLPAGVDEITHFAREVLRPDASFVDLGAGLGRVVILAHLLSGARGRGIELQPSLVAASRRIAGALGVRVRLDEGDATVAPLDEGVFFLYAPFNGAMMRTVLARLEARARRSPIVVVGVGIELAEGWLARRELGASTLAVWDSVTRG